MFNMHLRAKDPNVARSTARFYGCPDAAVDILQGYTERPVDETFTADSDTAIQLSIDTKPAYYGLLAHVVDNIIDVGISADTERPQAWRRDCFEKLEKSVFDRLQIGVDTVLNDTAMQSKLTTLKQAKALRSRLFSLEKNTSLESSLRDGSYTAAQTLVDYVKEMHRESYRTTLTKSEQVDAMKRSTAIVVAHASVNAWMLSVLAEPARRKKMEGSLRYDDQLGIFRRRSPLAETPLSVHEIKIYGESTSGSAENDARQLRDLRAGPVAAGCPIIYSGKGPHWRESHNIGAPAGLQCLQAYVVDQADSRNLL